MKIIQLTHIIEDIELEQKISELEKRCEKLNDVSLANILQAAITVMPMKTYMNALIMWVDDMVFELEQAEKK